MPRRIFLLATPAILLSLIAGAPPAQTDEWRSRIRPDHPRLFFNADTWPAVKARALGEEKSEFAAMKARVDELASSQLESADYGTQAAEAAFVFLVTSEGRYRDLARELLSRSISFYHERYRQQRSVNWYSFSRINAWAAYDWLFAHLAPEERRLLGASFLDAVENVQPTKSRKAFDRENWSGPISGFYGTPGLLWYAGLATYGEGIDDERAARFVQQGYDLFVRVCDYRQEASGDDGGSAAGSLNYAFAAYPWAEFNFFHTFRSATGGDIVQRWPYVTLFPAYIFWNWLPSDHEFGFGDAYHTTNKLPIGLLNLHLSQIIHFYAAVDPESASFAKWLMEKAPREQRATFPFARFLLTAMPDVKPAQKPAARMPRARRFENMGQTFFRSGSGPDDTYALFTAGGILQQHKHFDHNNFVIYRKGFLALDTGTRPEPGQHLSHYYARTVAHNCILIRMPGEEMPRYWGNPAPGEEVLPVPNDGGQRGRLGSKVVAFETNEHFSYVAGDATDVYHPDKCRLAVRQFVFLPPNHFVVFDRVRSTRPEYPKTWLLHTAAEPAIEGSEFTAAHDRGRLFSRTLLPEGARLAKIGGPGKQFWSDGRNWPLPPGYRVPDTLPLLGQWRVEVSPAQASADDVFLHLIEAGDLTQQRMAASELLREGARVGVHFQADGSTWEVLFGVDGPASGRVRLRRGDAVILDRELSGQVQPQTGLWGER